MNRTNFCTLLLATALTIATAAPPPGWFMAGSKPAEYDTGLDNATKFIGQSGAFLRSRGEGRPQGFGTLMQTFRAEPFRGKRVRFSAMVKTDGVEDWAGLWMRIDEGTKTVAFDNMQNRPLKGTSDWRKYDVVLDVSGSATTVNMGILLSAKGAVWMAGAQFEPVGNDVPVSSGPPAVPAGPRNLGFEN